MPTAHAEDLRPAEIRQRRISWRALSDSVLRSAQSSEFAAGELRNAGEKKNCARPAWLTRRSCARTTARARTVRRPRRRTPIRSPRRITSQRTTTPSSRVSLSRRRSDASAQSPIGAIGRTVRCDLLSTCGTSSASSDLFLDPASPGHADGERPRSLPRSDGGPNAAPRRVRPFRCYAQHVLQPLYSHGLYSYGLYSYDQHVLQPLYSHDLYSYGLYSYGQHVLQPYIVTAYIVMASTGSSPRQLPSVRSEVLSEEGSVLGRRSKRCGCGLRLMRRPSVVCRYLPAPQVSRAIGHRPRQCLTRGRSCRWGEKSRASAMATGMPKAGGGHIQSG